MSKPVVFVIGASGSIGSATVRHLSSRFSDKVEIRAGVRNPDKADKLKALKGVTVVRAEMGSSSLADTLQGVHALYIVTPGAEERVELTVSTAEAAKKAGVTFILVVSLPTANLLDTIYGRQFNKIEVSIPKLGVPYSFVRLPMFMDTLWANKGSMQQQSSIYGSVNPAQPITSVLAEDAGLASAIILSDPSKHAGRTYTLVSDRHNYNDITAAFSEALDKEVKYVQVPFEAVKHGLTAAGWPEWQIEGLKELMSLINAGAKEINVDDAGDFEKITGQKPTTLKAWLAQVGRAFAA